MRTTTTSTTLLFLLLLFSAFATAPLPPGGGSWAPSYIGMGITFINAPGGGDPFTRVTGTVTNPQPLLELGFTGSLKGLKSTVTPFYTAGFTMKEGGQEYAPSIVKVQVGNQYHIVAPQRGTGKLVSLAHGDTNAKPGGGSWVPSYVGMGIDFVDPPAAGASFTRVNGTITDLALMKEIGFEGAEEGMEILLLKEVPLYFNGEAKSLVRLETADYYEVYVVEEGGRLVCIKEYMNAE